MSQLSVRPRRHFIVKHGLDAFNELPNYIWRTNRNESDVPHRYNQVRVGDRWIGFAYTTSDNRERSLSLVTGFFECVTEARYGDIPERGRRRRASADEVKAWLIEGQACGEQPKYGFIGVPPLEQMLDGKKMWKNQAIVPITAVDFENIRQQTLNRQFDTSTIPLFGREPTNEQEVLAMVAFAHKELGIAEILGVRTAFPDLRVRFDGSYAEVHLELEVYSDSFFSHGHDKQVSNRCFIEKNEQKPIAVLCWIHNCKREMTSSVRQVYELQRLIREGKKMTWPPE